MMRLWMRIRLPLAILVVLVLSAGMARLFSGPEDGWIRDETGAWVMHGHPSGPRPADDYRQPVAWIVVPVAFLTAFFVPLFLLKQFRPRNRLLYDTVLRDLRFLGYAAVSLTIFGGILLAGTVMELAVSAGTVTDMGIVAVFVSLLTAGCLSILCGVMSWVLARSVNDNYQIERTRREILEVLERLVPENP